MYGIWIENIKDWASKTETDDSFGFTLSFQIPIVFNTEGEANKLAGIWRVAKPHVNYIVKKFSL